MFQKIIILTVSLIVLLFGLFSIQSHSVAPTQDEYVETVATTTNKQSIALEKNNLIIPKTEATPPYTPYTSVSVPQSSASDPQPSALVDFEFINTKAREATVNILCTTKGSDFSPISGTGMIINPDGLILTNAHVAQYFLLRDLYTKDFITCVIRTGSPAYPRYYAELVYISPVWIENNKAEIKEQNPLGSGERDYAFLRITNKIDGATLPTFSHLSPNIREEIERDEPVVLVSYPAGFLGGISIIQNLNITSAITDIQNIYTFKENTVDVIAVGGTVVSQKGASGGAVVDKNTTLIGIISTSSSGNTTSSRDLNAITLAYINRTLQSETGFTLSEFMSKNMADYAKTFQETKAPDLTRILIDEITKNQ